MIFPVMVAVTEHVLVPEFHVPILVQSPPFPSVMVNVPEAEAGEDVSAAPSKTTVTSNTAPPVFRDGPLGLLKTL